MAALRLKDVYGSCKKEMSASFDRGDLMSAVTRGKPGYANLNQLNVGSPGSDVSDVDDTTDLEELLAQGSTKGPQMHPGGRKDEKGVADTLLYEGSDLVLWRRHHLLRHLLVLGLLPPGATRLTIDCGYASGCMY